MVPKKACTLESFRFGNLAENAGEPAKEIEAIREKDCLHEIGPNCEQFGLVRFAG